MAESDGQIAGQIVGVTNTDNVAVVNWLFVEPSFVPAVWDAPYWMIFESRLADLPVHKMMLWTEIATGYYRKLGWTEEAVLPRHWWGKDFSVMSKYIK